MRHDACSSFGPFCVWSSLLGALNAMRCALTCTPAKLGLACPAPTIGCKQSISGVSLRSTSSARHVVGSRGEGQLSSLEDALRGTRDVACPRNCVPVVLIAGTRWLRCRGCLLLPVAGCFSAATRHPPLLRLCFAKHTHLGSPDTSLAVLNKGLAMLSDLQAAADAAAAAAGRSPWRRPPRRHPRRSGC
jgi:hypothetical protein